MPLPRWIEPQLCKLATKAPSGAQWAHEIKLDGYRMAARIENGWVKLLTRSGLDWTAKYPATAAAFAKLKVTTAYLDGELCGVGPDGVTSFELMQQGGEGLTYFAFDLLELDGEDIARLPLLERKKQLAALLRKAPAGI
jgi:ATP-dependent DNA ligase